MNVFRQPILLLLLNVTLLVGLSGCRTELSDLGLTAPPSEETQTIVKVKCPVLKAYPASYQTVTAAELRNAGPHVKELVTDYVALRDACRSLDPATAPGQ